MLASWARPWVALLAACASAGGEGAAFEPPPPVPCTPERLLAFEPGAPVRSRHALPPMTQRTTSRTEHVAVIDCREEEDDEACRERAEAELSERFSDSESVRAEVVSTRKRLVVELAIGEEKRLETFDDAESMRRRLRSLAAEGPPIEVLRTFTEPAPDAPRQAVVTAESPTDAGAREKLRASLTLEAVHDPVAALVVLQRRARQRRFEVHTFEPRDDGSVEVEIGCSRPLSEP